jgi:hypothetical protein
MPARFAAELAGYRSNGNPNTSDNNDAGSINLGRALFDVLGVPHSQPGPVDAGDALEEAVRAHLASLRPDLLVQRGQPALVFDQYAHLAVIKEFRRGYRAGEGMLAHLRAEVERVEDSKLMERLIAGLDLASADLRFQDELVAEMLAQMPEESLLKVDVTVGEPREEGLPLLAVALSSKWTLRTDRAQDCVSQGSKLVALRRGRMPHFAVVTMEPRPAMLKILGDGSGAIDCVYHVNLPALAEAIATLGRSQRNPESWSPGRTFQRLIAQNRLRDYDDLVAELRRVPVGPVHLPATSAVGDAAPSHSIGD